MLNKYYTRILSCSCNVKVEAMVRGCICFISQLWQDHKLRGLNNTNFSSLFSNSKYQKFTQISQGVFLFVSSNGQSVFLPFPTSHGCPHSLAHGSLPSSSKPAMSAKIFLCFYLLSTPHFCFPFSPLRILVIILFTPR